MNRNSRNPHACRVYGDDGPTVILLHGGPGAPGYLAPVARKLRDHVRVIEPFQRGSGESRLSVALHVADLQALIETRCAGAKPFVVGHSWGAMLALAHAASHPTSVRALVLIGCGTFDVKSRTQFERNCEARGGARLRNRLDRLAARLGDPNRKLKLLGSLMMRTFAVDLVAHEDETEECDARGHEETWADMLRLQEEGVYPASFSKIVAPVLMLHGADDPHPGDLIATTLRRHIPRIEYREFAACGHYPWLERAATDRFHRTLHDWLLQHECRDSC